MFTFFKISVCNLILFRNILFKNFSHFLKYMFLKVRRGFFLFCVLFCLSLSVLDYFISYPPISGMQPRILPITAYRTMWQSASLGRA